MNNHYSFIEGTLESMSRVSGHHYILAIKEKNIVRTVPLFSTNPLSLPESRGERVRLTSETQGFLGQKLVQRLEVAGMPVADTQFSASQASRLNSEYDKHLFFYRAA
jgi:hypothetical protein